MNGLIRDGTAKLNLPDQNYRRERGLKIHFLCQFDQKKFETTPQKNTHSDDAQSAENDDFTYINTYYTLESHLSWVRA